MINLPRPTPRQVDVFRDLYSREFGVTLSETEGSEVSNRFLQLFFLLHNAMDQIQPKE
jgi:hypothetical protein